MQYRIVHSTLHMLVHSCFTNMLFMSMLNQETREHMQYICPALKEALIRAHNNLQSSSGNT